jgi:ElaB/YqjD/DUF883 family membrane-anchored ribosome-binding protein
MTSMTHEIRGQQEHQADDPLEKAKEAGTQALDKAKEAVASVGEMATQAVSAVGTKVDNLTASAGTELKDLGDTISTKVPHDGVLGHASQALAETFYAGGQYIEDAKLSGMTKDVAELIRRNPMPAFLVGIGIGFMIGRAMRA